MKNLSKYFLFAVGIVFESKIFTEDISLLSENNSNLVELSDFAQNDSELCEYSLSCDNICFEENKNNLYEEIVNNITLSFMNLCDIENNYENLIKFNDYFSKLYNLYEGKFNFTLESIEKSKNVLFKNNSKNEIEKVIFNIKNKYSEKSFENIKNDFINSFIKSSFDEIEGVLELSLNELEDLLKNSSENNLDLFIINKIKNIKDNKEEIVKFKKNLYDYYESVSKIFFHYDDLINKVIDIDNIILETAELKLQELNNLKENEETNIV